VTVSVCVLVASCVRVATLPCAALSRSTFDKGVVVGGGAVSGDVPVYRAPLGVGDQKVVWKVPLSTIDVDLHVPRLCDQLRGPDADARSMAVEAMLDVLEVTAPERIVAVMPAAAASLRSTEEVVSRRRRLVRGA
jgi:hypothetical protein